MNDAQRPHGAEEILLRRMRAADPARTLEPATSRVPYLMEAAMSTTRGVACSATSQSQSSDKGWDWAGRSTHSHSTTLHALASLSQLHGICIFGVQRTTRTRDLGPPDRIPPRSDLGL